MIARTTFVFASFVALGLVGCSDDAPNGNATPDTGTPDTAADSASDMGGDGCVESAPAKGFAVLDEFPGPGDTSDRGMYSSMALDENGSPMVAYAKRGTDTIEVLFTRWDRSCSRWLPPVSVGTATDLTSSSRGISLAYDKTTHEVGIAYRAQVGVLTDKHGYEVRFASANLATSSAFTTTKIAAYSSEDVQSADDVALAMGSGKAYVLWASENVYCLTSGCAGIVIATRIGAAGDAGTSDAASDGASDAGADGGPTLPPEPTGWSLQVRPATYVEDHSISASIDGAGQLAWVWADGTLTTPVTSSIYFQRLDAGPVTVDKGIGTEFANGALAFDGTKPRIAYYLHQSDWATTGDTLWFASSDDGATFSSKTKVPRDKGDVWGHYVAIAVAGGKVAIGANIGEAGGDTMAMYGNPKWATATDLKTFTVSGPARTDYLGDTDWIQLAIGADGKLQFAFEQPTPGKSVKSGLVYFHE